MNKHYENDISANLNGYSRTSGKPHST